jgi:hypothetical protein
MARFAKNEKAKVDTKQFSLASQIKELYRISPFSTLGSLFKAIKAIRVAGFLGSGCLLTLKLSLQYVLINLPCYHLVVVPLTYI